MKNNAKDKQAILDIRRLNNQAIKAQNAAGVAVPYMDDFFILTSANDFIKSKKSVEDVFHSVFNSKIRSDVVFIRTPDNIKINQSGNESSEFGNWEGTWITNGRQVKVGGDYYAKWQKTDGFWKLRCEVFTQLE